MRCVKSRCERSEPKPYAQRCEVRQTALASMSAGGEALGALPHSSLGHIVAERRTGADAQQPALLRRSGSWARLTAGVRPTREVSNDCENKPAG